MSATQTNGGTWQRLSVFGLSPTTHQPYPPHPTQRKVFEWAVSSLRDRAGGIPVLYLQHGVRSGGTRAILNIILARLFTEPGLRALICRKEYADLRPSVMETVLEIIPPGCIAERNENEHRFVLHAHNTVTGERGASTLFFSGVKDVGSKGSQEFGVISVHEATELTLFDYRTLKNRLAQAGHLPLFLLEGNAPMDGHWLDQLATPGTTHYDADVTRVLLSSEENRAFLDPSYWQSLESMPSEWKRRYLLGETCALPDGTPVYPAFVESVHVRPTSLIPDRPLLRFWDFGFRRAACLWAQLTDAGQLLVHREWLALETPEEEFVEGVVRRTALHFGERVCQDFGDPAATQRDPSGISTLRRLAEHGILLTYRQTTYADRIPLVNARLSQLIHGEPAIIIHPVCQILREGLAGGYHYPPLSLVHPMTEGKQLPVKDGWFDHLCNAFEYGCVNLFRGAKPQQVERHREVVRQRHRYHARRRTIVCF